MSDAALTDAPSRTRIWVEFVGLFIAAPLLMALVLPPSMLFPGLFFVTALGIGLLHVTPGFEWSELTRGIGDISWRFVALFALATIATAYAVVQLTTPQSFLGLWRANPQLLLMIAVLYPLLSALPQELVFRPLFFRRYGSLLPRGLWPQIFLNAALFSAAHLMYWSWIVAAMTFSGGLAFAWSYRARGNFPEAVLTHSIAGIIVFTMGLGVFFYSGNVTRPF